MVMAALLLDGNPGRGRPFLTTDTMSVNRMLMVCGYPYSRGAGSQFVQPLLLLKYDLQLDLRQPLIMRILNVDSTRFGRFSQPFGHEYFIGGSLKAGNEGFDIWRSEVGYGISNQGGNGTTCICFVHLLVIRSRLRVL